MTNTGSEDLKVLRYGTVLDSEIPTRSFTVSRDGVTADFTGVKLQLDIDSLDDSAFTVIPAGETILVEHQGGFQRLRACCSSMLTRFHSSRLALQLREARRGCF